MAISTRPSSIRYVSGAIPLKKDCVAYSFHFAPENLKHFHLVYQNFLYRVFRVGGEAPEMTARLQYEPIYDIGVYCDPKDVGEIVDDSMIARGAQSLQWSDTHKALADWFFSVEDFETAVLEYERALRVDEKNAAAMWGLGKAKWRKEDRMEGVSTLITALDLDPALDIDVTGFDVSDAAMLTKLGMYEYGKKRYDRAEKLLKKALQLNPDQPRTAEILTRLKELISTQNHKTPENN